MPQPHGGHKGIFHREAAANASLCAGGQLYEIHVRDTVILDGFQYLYHAVHAVHGQKPLPAAPDRGLSAAKSPADPGPAGGGKGAGGIDAFHGAEKF